MNTADTIVKSLAKTYCKDFSNNDSKFSELNIFNDKGVVTNSFDDKSIIADYIGDNNYAGYNSIAKYILKLTLDPNYKYSILLIGDYNGLSHEARGMETNGQGIEKGACVDKHSGDMQKLPRTSCFVRLILLSCFTRTIFILDF